MNRRMQFSNGQIDLDTIPTVQDIDYVGLERSYLTVELIATGIFWTIAGVGATTLIYLNVWGLPPEINKFLYLILALLIVLSFVLLILGFRKKKYALRERDIIYQSGLLWRNHTVLPFNRVQHAEVQQGPIDRLFNLGRLKIYTAGGSSSDMTIAGLSHDKAQSLKHFILHQTSKDEEE